MLGFLKKKLSKVIDSLSGKAKEKEEEKLEEHVADQVPEPIEPVREIPEEREEVRRPAPEELFEPVPEEKLVEPEEELEPKGPETKPEPIVEKVEIPKAEPEKKKSFFQRITEKVVKSVAHKRLSEGDVDPILADFEDSMIEADVAVEVAEKIKGDLRGSLVDREIKRGKEKDAVVEALRKSLMGILDVPKMDLGSRLKEKKPFVIVFWGFNGAGKTTSLAKTASWLKKKGHTCVFAAADTFRAGAEEQLEIHAEKIGVRVIKHDYGADPAAVIFDAIEHAKARGVDFVLADTAGRAHTNSDLMAEMRKIVRVNKPDMKILVIDSLTGNDALVQARMYGEVGVDALVFTKVDVNEKGGAILSVTHELKKPILFLGQGQEYSEFEEFDAEKFVNNLLS